MTRLPYRKLLLAALGGFVVAGLVLTFMLAFGFDGLGRATVVSGTGWMLPLLAGALTGLVAWVLVRGGESRGPSCDWRVTGVACPSCGGLVRADWRLCPHCGDRINSV